MILHRTSKLAAKLNPVSDTALEETSPLGGWHGQLYTINRRQCLLLCHDQTRYSLFLPGLRKAEFAKLDTLVRASFLASMVASGVDEAQVKQLAMQLGPLRFDRHTDKSVLGSLRVAGSDLEGLVKHFSANVMTVDPIALSLHLSDRPTTVHKKWIWPSKDMKALADSLACGSEP